jgi:Mn2+/Fe2+ NRAMP family transporter
MARLEQR